MATENRPQWANNWPEWDREWAFYWAKRYHDIYSAWFTGPKTAEDIQKLTQALKDFAVEKTTTIHPGLWQLGQRMIAAQLLPTDYKIAEFYLSVHPEAALGPDKKPLPGWTGFSGPSPIEQYQLGQVYVAAKNALVLRERAYRRVERLTEKQAAQMLTDYEAYKAFGSDDPNNPLPWPTYPPEYHWLATAHSYGGHMTAERYKNAAAWVTITRMAPLLGEESQPKPCQPGYVPMAPLDDPHWQDVEYYQLQKSAAKRGRKD